MLASGKESYDKTREHFKRQRPHFADKEYSQSYCFSSSHVWMWELNHKEDWAPKSWCFELCRRRLLRVRWAARRLSQSILKEISPEYSLVGLLLKLKLHYFGTWWEELTHWERPWCWRRLKAGGEEDDRGWDDWMASPTQWTWVEQTSGDNEGQGSLACFSLWGRRVRHNRYCTTSS